MAGKGGYIPGSGRKKKVDEEWARNLCIKAVINKYGSLESGIEAILNSKEERLKAFIWTHVLGSVETTSKVKLADNKGGKLDSGILGGGKVIVEVVRTEHNKSVNPGDVQNENNDSPRLPDVQF